METPNDDTNRQLFNACTKMMVENGKKLPYSVHQFPFFLRNAPTPNYIVKDLLKIVSLKKPGLEEIMKPPTKNLSIK